MSLVYAAEGMGITGYGPGGVLISLGIEYVITNNTVLVTQLYNYWSIITTMIIAIVSGQRDARFMTILMCLWAGLCLFSRWLVYSNPLVGFGVLFVCTLIAIISYMQESRHERFGIAGPGNVIVKIFMYLVIMQAVTGFVYSANIFPSGTQPIAPVNTQYTNINLNNEMGNINSAGGLTANVVDIATILFQTGYSILLVFMKMLISIALISVVLYSTFPWFSQSGAAGLAFLVVLQFAIWLMYMLFMFTIMFKPSPDPGY
jgi:hypothetical protein